MKNKGPQIFQPEVSQRHICVESLKKKTPKNNDIMEKTSEMVEW